MISRTMRGFAFIKRTPVSTQHIAHVWPGKKDVPAFLVTFIITHTAHLEMASRSIIFSDTQCSFNKRM